MKSFGTVLGKEFIDMLDGVQEFPGSVVSVMSEQRLWDDFYQCYKTTKDGVDYYIGIGGDINATYFKSDGQRYCVTLFAAKDNKCVTMSCLTSHTQKEITADVKNLKERIGNFSFFNMNTPTHENEETDFEGYLEYQKKSYPWQCAIDGTLVKHI